jgi:mycoredoxin
MANTTANTTTDQAPATTGQSGALIVYGHDFCPLSRSVRRALNENHIAFEWRDVETGDPSYRDELKKLASGFVSVPTVIFPDGTVMVEPNSTAVLKKLAAEQPAEPASAPAPDKGKGSILSRIFGK